MVTRLMTQYKHINWLVADQLVVSGANFFTGLYIARLLGLEQFGHYTIIWLMVQFFSSMQESFLLSPMMSITAKLPSNMAHRYLSGVISIGLSYSLIMTTLLMAISLIANISFLNISTSALISLFLVMLFFLIQEMLRRYLFTCERRKVAFFNDAITHIGHVFLLILFTFSKENIVLMDVFLTRAISSFVAILFTLLVIEKFNYTKGNAIYAWKRNWPMSKWMVSSAITHWLTSNLFIIAAGLHLGNTAVGALKAAQNILGINHIFFQLIENTVPVRASKLLIRFGINNMTNYLKKITIMSGIGLLFLSILIVIFSNEIMTIIYNKEYAQYSWLLVGYAFIYFLIFLSFPLRIFLRTIEKTKQIFYAYLVTALFSIFASNVFVANMGLNGAIYGMISLNIIMLIILYFYARKEKHYYKNNSTL